MDLSSLPAGLSGTVGTMQPVMHRLALFIQKRSKKKAAREHLRNSLGAIEKMEDATKEVMDLGREFDEMIDRIQPPIQPPVADKLYDITGRWLIVTGKIIVDIVDLAEQATYVARFEPFMEDLKHLDTPAHQLIMMLNRSYTEKDDGKVRVRRLDLSEFPTYLSLYAPKVKAKVQPSEQLQKTSDAYLDKMEEIVESLPEPWRSRQPMLRKAWEGVEDARKLIVSKDSTTASSLMDRSPEWLRAMDGVSEKAINRAVQIGLRKAQRYHPKKPSAPPNRWGKN